MDVAALLAAIPAALLALVALLGTAWAVLGRRRAPPAAPPPAVAAVIEGAHVRQVERAEAEAAEVVADAAKVDALPARARNEAVGARLRK